MNTDALYTTQNPDKLREIAIGLLTVQEQRIAEREEALKLARQARFGRKGEAFTGEQRQMAEVMADGFSRCEARPHYVDWLTMQLDRMKDSGRDLHAVCHDISVLLGTTDNSPGRASVAFVIADDREYHYASLGDTRIYWLNRYDRTRDHSLAERCVSLGQCPPDAIRFHPLRNRLFAWAGNGRGIMHEMKWHPREYQEDHSLLLCTDGFWSQVSDDDIYPLRSAAALRERCTRLSADNNSSPDNLTVALLRQRPGC